MSIGIFTDNSYFKFPEKPNRTPFQRLTLLATTIILWSVFLVGLCLLFAPAYAQPVINPSVEHGPIWCQNSLTGWICDMIEGKAGAPGAQGPQGIMNQTPNMTLTLPTTYYLHNATTTANSSVFHTMKRYYPTGAEDSNTTTLSTPNQDYLLAQFITDEGDPNLAALPPGDRKWFTYVSADSLSTGPIHLRYRLYAYHTNGTKTLIYSFTGQNLYDTAITRIVDQYTLDSAFPMNTSDRFIMEYYANTTSAADRTVTMYWDDNSHVSKIESPITLTGLQGPKGDTGTAINESYAYLPGRPGGQVLTGGTGANDDLILNGTSSSTKTSSYVILQPGGGNVGIGNVSDFTKLVNMRSSGGGSAHLRFETSANGATISTAGGSTNSILYLAPSQTGESGRVRIYDGILDSRMVLDIYNASTRTILFDSGGSSYFSSTTARLGLGTTAPSTQLHTTGGVRFANFSSGTLMVDASGNLYTASDEKLKNNIKSLKISQKIQTTTAAQKITALNPVTFKFGASSGLNTDQIHTGFIAQEVEKVIPEAVSTKADVRYEQKLIKKSTSNADLDEYETVEIPTGTYTKSLDDRAIIATMVLAMQEQQAEIDQLKAEVARLEGKKVDKS